MLKPDRTVEQHVPFFQPPSGGCVLKPQSDAAMNRNCFQPPSGGCVLKPIQNSNQLLFVLPAAFGRLCVETNKSWSSIYLVRTSRLRAAVC